MLSTTAAYLAVSSNLTRAKASISADPTVKRDTDYYLANIGKVTTAAQFVKNDRLFTYAMKAFGLEDLTYAKGLISKVLDGGIKSSSSLANTLKDPRYKAFATAFDFLGKGAAATQAKEATTAVTSKYVQQALEDKEGRQSTGVKLALYFTRNASTITSTYGLLADPAMLKVVQTTFGISPYSSHADVDVQADFLKKFIDVKDLQDPTKVAKLVKRFTAMWDVSGNNQNATSAIGALFSKSGGSGLSADLMISLAGLKLGG